MVINKEDFLWIVFYIFSSLKSTTSVSLQALHPDKYT